RGGKGQRLRSGSESRGLGGTAMKEQSTAVLRRGEEVAADRQPKISVRKATKLYEGTAAIESIDFDVYPGEVHALVGENGAGKSTLCKAIAGAVSLTSGEIRLDGELCEFKTPADALRRGIAMVYQEDSLVPTMTVAQNVQLGRERFLSRFRTINIGAQQLL